jgi:microcystin degradation protein MlrC
MSRRLRIAFARIAQETNALSPVETTLRDFERTHFAEGDALLRSCQPGGEEAPGFTKRAELAGFLDAVREAKGVDIEPVPLFSAWAVPGGPLSRETYDGLRDRLTDGLRRAGDLDGVYLCLHGAMGVTGVRDPESALIRAAHEASGGKPIAVSHDLHANITSSRLSACDVLVGYRTNPHRDHASTGKNAGSILIRKLLGEVRPTTAWRSLPMLVGGGATVDVLPPMWPIFLRMRTMLRDPRVLHANVYMCHLWNDDPDLGWSTVVTTNNEPSLAEDLADELAERCWAVRDIQPPRFSPASEAISAAREASLSRKLGVVCLSDASDVVAAGGTGENTLLLAALLEEAQGLLSYVPLRDPEVVAALWGTPVGERVTVKVGGKLDPARNQALEVTGTVQRAQRMPGFERMIVLDLGHVRLVLVEGPALTMKPAFYEDVGLSVWRADIVVVKSFFPFRLFFLPMARKTIYVKTKGITDIDAAFGLTFNEPMHPVANVSDWRPADARRRALAST